MVLRWVTAVLVSCIFFSELALAQATSAQPPAAQGSTDKVAEELSRQGSSVPKLMDGIELEAVETYMNPKPSQMSLGVGIYPFDAYFYGLSINAGYKFHTSRTFAWEVLNAQYFINFQKDLTAELADLYGVQPRQINTVNFIISSDAQYVFAYGKVALNESHIRYFRISALGGPAAVFLDSGVEFGVLMGVKFEVFTKDSFSWLLEVRDHLTIPQLNNYMTFTLGTGFSF